MNAGHEGADHRQVRQMLRLHLDGLGAREIGPRLGVAAPSKTTLSALKQPSWCGRCLRI
jgi:hypothetical protein